MATTREMINWMKQQAEGWNRTGERGLLEVLDHAQEILMDQESHQHIAYRTDGKLPHLTTVDGTYQYTLDQATTGLAFDIHKVDDVLVPADLVIDFDYDIFPHYRPPHEPMLFNGIEYLRFYEVATTEALQGSYPTLTFRVNPGDTTKQFYILSYKKAATLTSESVALSVPKKYHHTTLLPVAMLLLEARQNGTFVENLEVIEQRYAKRFRQDMDRGAQGVSYSINRREA